MPKVYVVKQVGDSSTLGMMNAIVGLTTDQGVISDVTSTEEIVSVSGANDLIEKHYAQQLYVTETLATGSYSFPTGDGSFSFSKYEIMWADGKPKPTNDSFHVSMIGNQPIVKNY